MIIGIEGSFRTEMGWIFPTHKNFKLVSFDEAKIMDMNNVDAFIQTNVLGLIKNKMTDQHNFIESTGKPRIVIELEGFEDLLASTSETFNDKIVEAILSSEDLTKLFEMKSDGTGQFDTVISNATDAIILEIRNLILSEMGFDPATNFTTFKSF